MVAERLLLRQSLPNGLVLEVYNRSQPMAGDRWQVVLEGHVFITVSEAVLPADLKERAQEVIATLGPEIVFIQQDIRHFIDVREVPAILQEMQERLLKDLGPYLGHADFAGRYIRKKFAEHQQRRDWYRE